MHGFILFTRYGSKTVVGCRECVRGEVLRNLGINAIAGWWCIPWGIATPLVVVQNLATLWMPSDNAVLVDVLHRAGLDPENLRLDDEGFTSEQRRLIDAACYVLTTAVWADGAEHPRERERALDILKQFTGGRLSRAAAQQRIARGRHFSHSLNDLSFELRQTLLAMALDIAIADGDLTLQEIATLHAVAEKLGFAPGTVEALLQKAFGRTGRDEAESRRQARRGRQGAPGTDEVDRACAVLGVRTTATLLEIKQAWRREILKYHPDRAGQDRAKQRDLHTRAQEINWAYETLQRQAAAGLTPTG